MIMFQPLIVETRGKDLFYTRELLDATEAALEMKIYQHYHLSRTCS